MTARQLFRGREPVECRGSRRKLRVCETSLRRQRFIEAVPTCSYDAMDLTAMTPTMKPRPSNSPLCISHSVESGMRLHKLGAIPAASFY